MVAFYLLLGTLGTVVLVSFVISFLDYRRTLRINKRFPEKNYAPYNHNP